MEFVNFITFINFINAISFINFIWLLQIFLLIMNNLATNLFNPEVHYSINFGEYFYLFVFIFRLMLKQFGIDWSYLLIVLIHFYSKLLVMNYLTIDLINQQFIYWFNLIQILFSFKNSIFLKEIQINSHVILQVIWRNF